MTTQETVPAQAAPAAASETAQADATGGIGSERSEAPPFPRSPAAAEAKTAAAADAARASSSPSSPPSPSPSPSSSASASLVPVAHSSRGGGIVEAPQGWGQALSAVSSKQERRKKSLDPSLQQRAAADFLWDAPLPEATAAEDERSGWRLSRCGRACVLRRAPLAAGLIDSSSPSSSSSLSSSSSSSPSPRLQQLSLEAIAEMGSSEKESETEGEESDDDGEDGDGAGAAAPPRPLRIPAALLAGGPRAPPELHALDERKNRPGAHYRIRFPPATVLSEGPGKGGKKGGERGGGGGGGSGGSALSSLAAAASSWEGRPCLLTARLLTGGSSEREPAAGGGGKEDGDEALRRLVREGIDWGWLSSLAGDAGGGGGGDDGGGGESPAPPRSCWLPPSAVDCEWAGGAAAGSSSRGCGAAVVLPASYATHDRVLAQVRGTRRVLVARPRDALEKCYPLAAAHPCDGASAVRWRDPDLERWPRFRSLRCLWAELGPGDVLRVPAYWMLHSELLPPAATSAAKKEGRAGSGGERRGGGGGAPSPSAAARERCVTLVLRSPAARARRDRGSLLLQAARQAELELLRVHSPAKTPQAMRDLLRAVERGGGGGGGGGGAPSSSSSSSAGASAEREAVAAALGDLRAACLGCARSLLSALEAAADPRRFARTPWLEADGAPGRLFPPALPWTTAAAAAKAGGAGEGEGGSSRPRLFLDSRTEEERKYPSLFRATIEAKARERIPWIPRKKQLLLEQEHREKEEKREERERGGEAPLLLLEPVE